jgi:hypothetical protein
MASMASMTRTRILSGLVQPVLFLFVLGYSMSGLVGTIGGSLSISSSTPTSSP